MKLIDAIDAEVFGVQFECILGFDSDVFWLQLRFMIDIDVHRGRKWRVSPYMLDDEIVKTVWLAFEVAVKHELLEGFRFSGELVFNPHTPFSKFVEASRTEVFRPEPES
jgi:hypothetical protein